MFTHVTALRILIIFGLCIGTATPSLAQRMVSVTGSVVNMREGPGLRSPVLWELTRGYPLQVVGSKGSWLHVRDFENDRGWVSRSLTARTPYHVVKVPVANLRSGPGLKNKVVGRATYGEVLRTRAQRAGWVRVQRDGGQTGWVARRLLWGW